MDDILKDSSFFTHFTLDKNKLQPSIASHLTGVSTVLHSEAPTTTMEPSISQHPLITSTTSEEVPTQQKLAPPSITLVDLHPESAASVILPSEEKNKVSKRQGSSMEKPKEKKQKTIPKVRSFFH